MRMTSGPFFGYLQRITLFLVVLVLLGSCQRHSALPTLVTPVQADVIDFATPMLGEDLQRVINPFVDRATQVTFTVESRGGDKAVVGLVKNRVTPTCVGPADDDQKLGTGQQLATGQQRIGQGGFAIRATFRGLLAPPVVVSVEFQTEAQRRVRLRLFGLNGTEVATTTDAALPEGGRCDISGGPRARKFLAVTSTQPVAFAIMDMDPATGNVAFVLDNFKFFSGMNIVCTVDGTEKQSCIGTDESEVIIGTEQGDVILGRGGNDMIQGLGGNDVIDGGSGSDLIDGGPGDDRLVGGDGHDILLFGKGNNTLFAGQSTAAGTCASNSGRCMPDVNKCYEVRGGGTLKYVGCGGGDLCPGTRGNDTILGCGGNDLIVGNGGMDTIDGGAGSNDRCIANTSSACICCENVSGCTSSCPP